MSAPRNSNVDRAIEIVRSGKAESFADAARQASCSPSAVSTRWAREEGDRKPRFKAKAADAKLVDKAIGTGSVPDPDPTPREQELARKVLTVEAGRGRAQTEAREAKRQVADLKEQLTEAKDALQLVDAVSNVSQPDWLGTPKDEGAKRGTLIALFSDFHVGEVVEPSEMNGYNAYNPEIAEKRIHRFFERTILVSRQYLAGVKYDGIVVPSLGDTISGDIHDEFRETNELSNFEAVPFVVPLLQRGFEMLLEEYPKVHVPCVPGNHPRDSRKPRYKKRSAHNADTMIMKLLAKYFEGEDRITFDVPDGISADFSVYDTKFRIEHGDEATGGGGIQGAMLPIALRTHRIRKQAQAEGTPFDVLMLGHWHQLMSMPAKGFIVNGAGKGYDEYARGKGFEPEPPQQALMVVTPEHGISVQAPLFVSKRSDEGW